MFLALKSSVPPSIHIGPGSFFTPHFLPRSATAWARPLVDTVRTSGRHGGCDYSSTNCVLPSLKSQQTPFFCFPHSMFLSSTIVILNIRSVTKLDTKYDMLRSRTLAGLAFQYTRLDITSSRLHITHSLTHSLSPNHQVTPKRYPAPPSTAHHSSPFPPNTPPSRPSTSTPPRRPGP